MIDVVEISIRFVKLYRKGVISFAWQSYRRFYRERNRKAFCFVFVSFVIFYL